MRWTATNSSRRAGNSASITTWHHRLPRRRSTKDSIVGHAFPEDWARETHASCGMLLPRELPIDSVSGRHAAFFRLTQAYYDPTIETIHTGIGGVTHLGLGYGRCALPVVLEHNTPNNSIALLWAETDGTGVNPAMRPLFRRRHRHA